MASINPECNRDATNVPKKQAPFMYAASLEKKNITKGRSHGTNVTKHGGTTIDKSLSWTGPTDKKNACKNCCIDGTNVPKKTSNNITGTVLGYSFPLKHSIFPFEITWDVCGISSFYFLHHAPTDIWEQRNVMYV